MRTTKEIIENLESWQESERGKPISLTINAAIVELKRLYAAAAQADEISNHLDDATAENEKLRVTTSRICGAHIGAVDVHLTGNFTLGCPCCQRDCAQISLQGYITAATVAEPANVALCQPAERDVDIEVLRARIQELEEIVRVKSDAVKKQMQMHTQLKITPPKYLVEAARFGESEFEKQKH
jgi:proteasome assembly chaperone (PAC2) family protein